MSKNRGVQCAICRHCRIFKKTNAEQIAQKERFVSLWGQATKEVPATMSWFARTGADRGRKVR